MHLSPINNKLRDKKKDSWGSKLKEEKFLMVLISINEASSSNGHKITSNTTNKKFFNKCQDDFLE